MFLKKESNLINLVKQSIVEVNTTFEDQQLMCSRSKEIFKLIPLIEVTNPEVIITVKRWKSYEPVMIITIKKRLFKLV